MNFSRQVGESLAQCSSLADIEAATLALCKREFKTLTVAFDCHERELYVASSDPQAALAFLGRQARNAEIASVSATNETVLKRAKLPSGFGRLPFQGQRLDVDMPIDAEFGRLGTVHISLLRSPHERVVVVAMVDALKSGLKQHWHRIRVLVDQKLLAYRFLMEQARGDILKRFLTDVLVGRFTDARTMEENLKSVLTPRPTRAALMQADIRGYSKLSFKLKPEEMVRILQGYFRDVVDAASRVAQVKLIRDCIFLFIEEEAAPPGKTPVDLAVELASILVRETLKQNDLRTKEGIEALNFGIAIHYGDVVVGNLSSDHCIDYTVIGSNVNLVARLEELTKNPAIVGLTGTNGLVLSPEASANLQHFHGLTTTNIALEEMGIAVRSFAHVTHVEGVSAITLLALQKHDQMALPAAI